MPVSTTHAKTVSIIGVAKVSKEKFNMKSFMGICRTWIYTFPICLIISFILATVLKVIV